MGQETVNYGLSRRQLIGAAAGTAAGAALATAGPLGSRAFADSDPSATDARLPHWQIGFISYSTRGSGVLPSNSGNYPEQREFWTQELQAAGNKAVEVYGNNNWGFGGNNASARQQMRQWCEDHDMEVVADHGGPQTSAGASPTEGTINGWIERCNSYGYVNLGQGGGWSGSNTVANWLTQSANANNVGQAMQAGTATSDGVPGARWYGHNHTGEWAVIPEGNDEWTGMRYEEIALAQQDVNYAFCQFDLAWLRGGVPSNQVWYDLGTHYSNDYVDGKTKVALYHIKGKENEGAGNDRDVNIPEDMLTSGSPNWQDFFEALEDPSAHTYLWERDGATSVEAISLSIPRFRDLLYDTDLDRSEIGAPGIVENPNVIYPGHNNAGAKARTRGDNRGEFVRHPQKVFSFQWTRNGMRIPGATSSTYHTGAADAGKEIQVWVSAINNSGATPAPSDPVALSGGPGNTTPPSLSGSGAIGTMITCDRGEWDGGGSYSYQWLADGSPVAQGMGAGQTGSTNPARFRARAEWSGQEITCHVTRTNPWGSTTVPTSNSVVVGA